MQTENNRPADHTRSSKAIKIPLMLPIMESDIAFMMGIEYALDTFEEAELFRHQRPET